MLCILLTQTPYSISNSWLERARDDAGIDCGMGKITNTALWQTGEVLGESQSSSSTDEDESGLHCDGNDVVVWLMKMVR